MGGTARLHRAKGVRVLIRYTLTCANECAFEAWFRSSADYDAQAANGQISCPDCGDTQIEKAPMAPAVGMAKAERRDAWRRDMAREVRREIAEKFDYVGDKFATEARRIAEGAIADRPIWGEASLDDAKEMIEEGLPVTPLPDDFAPAKPKKNTAKIN
jgi:hypothetical protein